MPIFEYKCSKCDEQFDVMTSIAERDEQQACPSCEKGVGKRILSLFASPAGRTSGGLPGGGCSSGGGFT